MQAGQDADPGAEVFGSAAMVRASGRRPEQQVIDDAPVLVGECADRRRQGKKDVEVGDGEQFGLTGGQPFPGRAL